MARERPTVSHADNERLLPRLASGEAPNGGPPTRDEAATARRSAPLMRHRQPPGPEAVLSEELIAIVIRASQLGYCPWRVGIALRVPPMELAWICTRPRPGALTAKTLTATLRGAPTSALEPPARPSAPRGADAYPRA